MWLKGKLLKYLLQILILFYLQLVGYKKIGEMYKNVSPVVKMKKHHDHKLHIYSIKIKYIKK